MFFFNLSQAARRFVMKKRGNKLREEDESLCCCEYVNRLGERSHVAACFCDCEDLDDVCDKWETFNSRDAATGREQTWT